MVARHKTQVHATVSETVRQDIYRAAQMMGETVGDFVGQAARDRADDVIRSADEKWHRTC